MILCKINISSLILFGIILFLIIPVQSTLVKPEMSFDGAELTNEISAAGEYSWATWVRDQNQNKIDDLLDERVENNNQEKVNIYINYLTQPSKTDVSSLKQLGINISYQAKFIPTVCARDVPIRSIHQIVTLNNIAMIEEQPWLVPLLDVSAGSVKARDSIEYSPETAWELGYTGRNIVIAVLDTGVDDRHESLKDKYIAGYDCSSRIPRETNPDDEDGHGTHVAGIAMGTGGEEGQYRGIAPNAKLIDVKVLSDIGLTPGDQIIQGIEWCIDQKDTYDIRILSISIGEIFRGNDDGQGTQGRLVNTAVEAGLVVIVAAGNDGEKGFSSLAAADLAITVGSIDEKESVTRVDDEVSEFSNRGPRADDNDEDVLDEYKPDVVAPGEDIMSALYSSTPVGLVTGYQQMSGTSMACPHIAGVAALILEANPNLAPEQVKQILHETAEARGNPYHFINDPKYNKDYGWGIVDAFEAVRKAVGEDYQLVSVSSHQINEQVYNIITIQGTASISKGSIQQIEFNINSEEWQIADGTENWEFEFDTTTIGNGMIGINIRSFDGIEYSNPIELPLNIVNIGCEFFNPLNGTTLKDTIKIQGTSFGAGVNEVLIKIDDNSWAEVEPDEGVGNLSEWSYSWNSRSVGNGIHTISLKAYNGIWYSIPVSIDVKVKNSKSDGGFLNGFDWYFVIIALALLVLLNYNHRRRSNL